MRLTVGGGGAGSSRVLLGAELQILNEGEQDQVLQVAGIRNPKPPPDLGLQLKTEVNLTWAELRKLKRLE